MLPLLRPFYGVRKTPEPCPNLALFLEPEKPEKVRVKLGLPGLKTYVKPWCNVVVLKHRKYSSFNSLCGFCVCRIIQGLENFGRRFSETPMKRAFFGDVR